MTPGTLTLAPSPNAVGVSVWLASLSLSFNSLSLLPLSNSVLADEVAGESGALKALPAAAAAAAKGEAVAFANEPKEGTELVSFIDDVLFVVVELDLNPPKPELLPNPPNVGF